MSVVLLVSGRGVETFITPQRIGMRHRIAVRLWARSLDEALAGGVVPESSAPLQLRATRLIDPVWRLRLACRLDSVVHGALRTGRRALGDTGISPRLVADVEPELTALRERLLDDDAVDVRGIASVRVLFRRHHGPLYGRYDGDPAVLSAALLRALRLLDPEA